LSFTHPHVSIIVATFNRAHLILETLVSIQNQLFQDWECLVIDDGGTDNTEALLQGLLSVDKRFSYHKRPDPYRKGLPGCRNYGLSLSKGRYIVFFDDDDWIHPQHLLLTTSFLDNQPQYGFCQYKKQPFETALPQHIAQYDVLTPLHEIGLPQLSDIVQEKIGMASCTVLWNKEALSLRFNEALQYAEEWELYSRLLSKGAKGVLVNEVLYYNRKHEASNTGEFWNGSTIRVNSKMQAAFCIVQTLQQQKMLDAAMRNYLFNIFIKHRGYSYFKSALPYSDYNILQKLKAQLYYFCFPFIFFIYKNYHQYAS
jgi:GalNAc5-diNAcBac-PP-undecaprenol beta-1,3-glucosyltransferase